MIFPSFFLGFFGNRIKGYMPLERKLEKTRSWERLSWKIRNAIGKNQAEKLDNRTEVGKCLNT